jgi:DNA recombination protein RmuC
METILLIMLSALLSGLVAALIVRRGAPTAPSDVEAMAGLQREVRALSDRVMSDSLQVTQRLEGIDNRMATGALAAQSITEAISDVRRATQTVADQAREFTSLQDILKPPRARGGVGEAMLEELLRQVLPPQSYTTQYRFRSGAIVDAVVRAGGKLVCIDSKFPLSNYRRMCDATDHRERSNAERDFAADVDRHVRAIATRYIVPDEDTFDFAVMYVPAEGVYGEVLRLSHRQRPLFEAAIEARVVPMSPLTMYGYLQTILFGLKCLRIETTAHEVLDHCGRLQQDIERFAEEYDTLGRHLGNARTKYEESGRRLARFRESLDRMTELDDDPAPNLEVVSDQARSTIPR